MHFNKQSTYPIKLDDQNTTLWTCYHYINRQENADLLDKLANGKLFHVVNPSTQEAIPFPYPCLFEDSQKRYLVFFIPDNAVPLENVSPQLFDGATNNYEQYTIRVTTHLSEFLEKINILDSQILDTEVECVKVLTHALLQEQTEETFFHLFFHEQDDKPAFALVTDQEPRVTEYKQELANIAHQRLGEKLHLPKGEVFHVDGNWAIDQLGLR